MCAPLHPQKHWGSLFPILWAPEPDIPSRHPPQREELLSLCLTASRWQSRVSKRHPDCQARASQDTLELWPGAWAPSSAHSCASAAKASPRPGFPVCRGTRGLCLRELTPARVRIQGPCACTGMVCRGANTCRGFSWLLRPGAQTLRAAGTQLNGAPCRHPRSVWVGLALCTCVCVYFLLVVPPVVRTTG